MNRFVSVVVGGGVVVLEEGGDTSFGQKGLAGRTMCDDIGLDYLSLYVCALCLFINVLERSIVYCVIISHLWILYMSPLYCHVLYRTINACMHLNIPSNCHQLHASITITTVLSFLG